MNVSDRVREACAWVASRARSVTIDEEAIASYAETLPSTIEAPQLDPETDVVDGNRETRAAFVICLDAINFGSGWWPTIRKRPGHSGYFTIAAGLAERFRAAGPWPADELTGLSVSDIAETVGQEPDHPLMADYAAALRDVGEHVAHEHGGSFVSVVETANGSAPALADLLATWVSFADVSTYEEKAVPFFKRAQLVPADLNRAGVATLRDERRLTAFADNLVPHVLPVDGVLRVEPALRESIESGELLRHDSAEEVELRACAVHCVELLAAAGEHGLSPAEIDSVLWNRGQQPRYKALPRPRSRNTAY
jgi:Queuosine salvage protein